MPWLPARSLAVPGLGLGVGNRGEPFQATEAWATVLCCILTLRNHLEVSMCTIEARGR